MIIVVATPQYLSRHGAPASALGESDPPLLSTTDPGIGTAGFHRQPGRFPKVEWGGDLMTMEELWQPDGVLGRPIRVGEWLYDGRISWAVRLFKGDAWRGSGDEEDPPEVRDDRAIECYYLQLQAAGEDRLAVAVGF
jgi:hypothetical protein